jgi:multidrug efflux pump subunit AcrB
MIHSALKNPYAVVAISLIVVILGIVSFQKMEVDIFPEINTPVVAVATFYKGMGQREIEGAITLRLEQLYLQASYVEHIESRSLDGISLIKIYFQPEYDVNAGLAEITSLTYSALRYLPKGMFPPTIIKFGASSLPIAQLTVSSPSLSEKEVRDLAYFTVRPQLAVVPGSAPLPPVGGTVRQITVFMDREKMLARGVSATEVVQALNAENLLIPAGNVKVGDFDYPILSNSLVPTAQSLDEIPIKVVNGVPLFIKDVATASDSFSTQTNAVRVNGHRAVYIPILKQAGANTIAVIDGMKDVVNRLTGLPESVEVKLIFDQSIYIRNAITSLQSEGLLGASLACLMILLFLGSIRSMFVIALTIPLSIATAFVLLYMTGHTINIMTLSGLALAVGTLVDNSIVVLENIHRHLGLGKSVSQAAGDGASEVALPMLVITISILIVYLPIMFFTGIIKFLFVPLALAVAYAMGASYVTSLTLAPVCIATFEKTHHHDHGKAEKAQAGGLGGRWARLNLFGKFVARYTRLLRWGMAHKTLVLMVIAGIFVGSMATAPLLMTEFFPKVDTGQFVLTVSAPEGTRLEKTEAMIERVEALIRRHIPADELDQILTDMGIRRGWIALYSPNPGTHAAYMLVNLVRHHRQGSWEYIDRIREDMLREFPGIKFAFQTGGIVTDVLNFGIPAPIDIKLSGPDLVVLQKPARAVRDLVASVEGTADVRVHQGMDSPSLFLNVDRTKAAYLGLTQEQVMANVTTSLTSNLSTTPGYWIDPRSNNAYFVVAMYPEQDLVRFEDFLDIPLVSAKKTSSGGNVTAGGTQTKGSSLALQNTPYSGSSVLPSGGNFGSDGANGGPAILLKDVVEVTRKTGPEEIAHFNLQPTIDVLANVPGGDLGRVATEIEHRLTGLELPKGVSLTVQGEANSMRNAIHSFIITLPMATLLIYLVMVSLFRSFLDPLIILFAVPLGFIGVIWMLLLTGTSVNVESMIGTLMMIGIVVANSVLLVDYANRRVSEGVPPEEAVVEAGQVRIRPILMTALAASLGVLPMALGIGEGAEANIPLARAVIGGLMFSMIMTLMLIPILYTLLRRGAVHAPAERSSHGH